MGRSTDGDWLGRALLAFAVGLLVLTVVALSSCAVLARVASTLEVGHTRGSGSTSGSLGGSMQQGGWYGSPGTFDGSFDEDSEFHAWTLSLRPLAALEPPREVVIVNMPAHSPAFVAPQPTALEKPPVLAGTPASGYGPDPQPSCAERTWHCAGCTRVVTEAGGSPTHECVQPAQPSVHLELVEPGRVTLHVDGQPVVLDALEPFKGPQQASPPSPPKAGKAEPDPQQGEESDLTVGDFVWPTSWAALGAALLWALPHLIRLFKAIKAKEAV